MSKKIVKIMSLYAMIAAILVGFAPSLAVYDCDCKTHIASLAGYYAVGLCVSTGSATIVYTVLVIALSYLAKNTPETISLLQRRESSVPILITLLGTGASVAAFLIAFLIRLITLSQLYAWIPVSVTLLGLCALLAMVCVWLYYSVRQ